MITVPMMAAALLPRPPSTTIHKIITDIIKSNVFTDTVWLYAVQSDPAMPAKKAPMVNERILYFNDDNLPVGSGPLPPMVGQTTSFKVYWTVTNNLHELTDARAVFILPAGVIWDGRHNTNVGNLYYDEVSRQVIWEIGRLPISVYRADAEFSISITPSESDRNKLLVLSPGSMISAMDRETMDVINLRINSKTTKLEDDDIAGLNNSGIVQ